MKYRIQILTILLVFAGLMLIYAGCSDKSLGGKLKINTPPTIEWASVGNDSLNHVNPVLHWFTRDQDGVVLDRLYTVLLQSTVDSLGGVDAVLANFPPSTWTIVHSDSASIPLAASEDTSVYIPQYVFVKAMDDDSLFSNIIYKAMARNNHRPTCYVVVPTVKVGSRDVPDPQWCLPETTSTFKGIRVAWVGKDSIDIPGIQPDFYWNIRLYGPFPDSASADTVGPYRQFYNSSDSSVWIRAKEMYLTDLETGWYRLYAQNRDDAFTPSIPALGKLSIYEPTWIRHPELTKQILIANHSLFMTDTSTYGFTQGELRVRSRDSVVAFYTQMVQTYLQQAGYPTDSYDWVDYKIGRRDYQVPKSDLYNHKLVLVLDTDYTSALSDGINQEQETPYARYMDVGGMVWVVGRRSFDTRAGRIDFGVTGDHNIAYNYFNLSGAFSQSLTNYAQAEFAGAASLVAGFPNIEVDTMKVAQCNWAYITRPPNVDTLIFNYSHGLIGVDYLMRRDNSETIYKYIAINPDTSAFHNFPVAVRYDKGTYKTSYFAFPLYFIQRDQAMEVGMRMLEWFFADRR